MTSISAIQEAFAREIDQVTSRQKKTKIAKIIGKYQAFKKVLHEDINESSNLKFILSHYDIDVTMEEENEQISKEERGQLVEMLETITNQAFEPFDKNQFSCDCGAKVSINAKPKHLRSSKHLLHERTVELEEQVKEYKGKYLELRRKTSEEKEQEEQEEIKNESDETK
jgi:hypothetical protein